MGAMNPNEQRPQPPTYQQPLPQAQAIDPSYLDQIATPVQKKTMNPLFLWVGIGAILLALLVGVFALLNSGGPSQTEKVSSFIFRVQALKKLSTDSTKSVQSSELRALNGSMGTILTGIDTTLQASAVTDKKSAKAPKGSKVTVEYEQIAQKLDDARLNVAFDRTYAREVAYQLGKLRSEMNYIYDGSKSKTLRTNLEKADADIKKLAADFTKFNQ